MTSADLMLGEPPAEPMDAFDAWFAEAEAAEPNDPNGMALATATPDGRPSLRMVLMKGHDIRGIVFYTNLESRKAGELIANPFASVLFHWKSLRRQIRIEGRIETVTADEADAYYRSRPRGSRIGAWASDQSRPLPDRSVLEARVAEIDARYPGDDIPRPGFWSGFRLVPERFEFWQDRRSRLHDRLIYEAKSTAVLDGTAGFGDKSTKDKWATLRLYP